MVIGKVFKTSPIIERPIFHSSLKLDLIVYFQRKIYILSAVFSCSLSNAERLASLIIVSG